METAQQMLRDVTCRLWSSLDTCTVPLPHRLEQVLPGSSPRVPARTSVSLLAEELIWHKK